MQEILPDIDASVNTLSQLLGDSCHQISTPAAQRQLLVKAKRLLEQTQTISSSTFPYKQLRSFLETALPSSDPSITILAAKVYLLLLQNVSISYSELSFSTSLHHMSRVLKTIEKKPRKKNPPANHGDTSESSEAHIHQFTDFWKQLVSLLKSGILDVSNESISSISIKNFVDIIRYSTSTQLLEISSSGIRCLIHNCASFNTIATVYKACVPCATKAILSANRRVLVTILLEAATREKEFMMHIEEDHDSNDDMSIDHPPSEEEVTISPLPAKETQSSSEVRYPIIRFFELCGLSASERAEERTSTCKIIEEVTSNLDVASFRRYQLSLVRTSSHRKTTVRMLAIEIVAAMMKEAERRQCPDVAIESLKILCSRSEDRMPTVRCKALHLMAIATASLAESFMNIIGSHIREAVDCIIPRIRDEKARVRKSALEYIGFAARKSVEWFDDSDKERDQKTLNSDMGEICDDKFQNSDPLHMGKLLCTRSTDISAFVRQTAGEQLSKLLLACTTTHASEDMCRRAFQLWAQGVLRMVEDNDQRCRQACVLQARSLFVEEIVPKRSLRSQEQAAEEQKTSRKLLLLLLSYIGDIRNSATQPGRTLSACMFESGHCSSEFVQFLCSLATTTSKCERDIHTRRGAWIFIESSAKVNKSGNVRSLLKDKLLEREFEAANSSAMKIAQYMVSSLSKKKRDSLEAKIRQIVLSKKSQQEKNHFTAEAIVAALELLATLKKDEGDELLNYCAELVLHQENGGEATAVFLMNVIGGICVSFKLTREPPQAILNFVQAAASQVQASSKVRALALSTLGKMCLCHGPGESAPNQQAVSSSQNDRTFSTMRIGESLTRRFVSLFVHELENATSSATRNNAVLVLCDLYRQHTAVVEPYIFRLSALLLNSSEFVRIQVISSLVSLLQEDYLKIRSGVLLFQIASCVLDSSEAVRAAAEYALLHVIAQKSSSVLATSFIELIFVLNGCTSCSAYNQFPREMKEMSLKSFEHLDHTTRRKVYDVFLGGMSADQRIRLSGRLRTDVLSLVAEEKMSMGTPAVCSVFQDTLNLLTFDALSASSKAKGSDEDDLNSTLDVVGGSNSNDASTGKDANLVQKLQSLELREATVPVLLELRRLLERLRSPLLKILMRTLCVLLRPHRKNLETMVPDNVVRAEIAHEISILQQELHPSRAQRGKRSKIPPRDDRDQSGNQARATPTAAGKNGVVGSNPATPEPSRRGDDTEKLSVPRSKRSKRPAQRLAIAESDVGEESDDDEPILHTDRRRAIMLDRISASPKLASMVKRPIAPGRHLDAHQKKIGSSSLFASAMARIEGETKS